MINKVWISLVVFTVLSGITQRAESPDRVLTPGASGAVALSDLCKSGYSKSVRNVPLSVKHQVYTEYGVVPMAGERFEIDHLVPLELGGTNSLRNLWPQPFAGTWTAGKKDTLENALHRDVCAGRQPLAAAQQEISVNWIAAFERRFSVKGGVV